MLKPFMSPLLLMACLGCLVGLHAAEGDSAGSVNTTGAAIEIMNTSAPSVAGQEEGTSPTFTVVVVAGLLGAVCAGWQAFRYLTAPKKTPAPLLADSELADGGAHEAGGAAMWMGGGGSVSGARQMVGEQPGFTQF